MLELCRTVRFAINPPGASAVQGAVQNGFAGHPAMSGLGRHYEIDVSCLGQADPVTGYFLNIKVIDEAVRCCAIPLIESACNDRPTTDPTQLLPELISALRSRLGDRLAAVRWRLTPYYCVEMASCDTSRALLRQRFEFAAAHRLHSPDLSDEENRRIFGKCNSPEGHGHNYRIEPCVATPIGTGSEGFSLADLERVTKRTVLDRFDHKNLNRDTEEFADDGGLNPSVENIAMVCFKLLEAAVSELPGEAELRNVTVWETEKTSCTYPAP